MNKIDPWTRVADPEFVREHNPILYIIGNTIHVATTEGIVAKGNWPGGPLTNRQQLDILCRLVKLDPNPLAQSSRGRASRIRGCAG